MNLEKKMLIILKNINMLKKEHMFRLELFFRYISIAIKY